MEVEGRADFLQSRLEMRAYASDKCAVETGGGIEVFSLG